jgi:DNA helicase HerA-like ATPase
VAAVIQDTQFRRDQSDQPLGRVVAVGGSQASVRLDASRGAGQAHATRPTVGRFLRIDSSDSVLIGLITNVAALATAGDADSRDPPVVAQIDLFGEIKVMPDGGSRFQRGVTRYPIIGDPARLVANGELRLIYDVRGTGAIHIGQLQQDSAVDACLDVDHMLSKHFALLGSSGVGKSSGVAILLREILAARPNLRIFIVDPHNEYGRCFADRAEVLTPRNLDLPFWLFNFEEIVDVFFRGRPGVEEEVEILSEVIPLAKARYAAERELLERRSIRKAEPTQTAFTLDTPVPYRLADLIALIDERMGKLEKPAAWTKYNRLITRIETVRNDPRYGFMFDKANVGGDTMAGVIGHLFRLPPNGRPMTIMQLAGFPSEVVDAVVSVVGRMAFELGLWSDGAMPLVFLCEEAHRYAPADRSIGFGPTRKALSRIAKEGRKYGVFLGLVTQRPSELDATIVSQCGTILAMRMANERDQAIVRSAVSDAAASLVSFVPSLGTREVFAFGEGVALPTRLHFKELPAAMLPRSEAFGHTASEPGADLGPDALARVLERWRGATMRGRGEPAVTERLAADDATAPSGAAAWPVDVAQIQPRVAEAEADEADSHPAHAPARDPADLRALRARLRRDRR